MMVMMVVVVVVPSATQNRSADQTTHATYWGCFDAQTQTQNKETYFIWLGFQKRW